MDQKIIDRAVKIATRAAMNRNPVESITWITPVSASSDPGGIFAVKYCRTLSASEPAPWEE